MFSNINVVRLQRIASEGRSWRACGMAGYCTWLGMSPGAARSRTACSRRWRALPGAARRERRTQLPGLFYLPFLPRGALYLSSLSSGIHLRARQNFSRI